MKCQIELLVLVLSLIFFVACGGGSGSEEEFIEPSPVNNLPVANAGDDQEVDEGTSVKIDGSGIDSDGSIESYVWTQVSGIDVELSNTDQQSLSFTAPIVDVNQTLQFQLEVTDNDGGSHSDSVDILILNIPDPVTLFSIGGEIADLNGQIALSLNDQSSLTLEENTSFSFDLKLAEGENYVVAIDTQPIGQECDLSNSSGVVSGDVTNIDIKCVQVAVQECNDGIDNDADGLIDWQFDLGCSQSNDNSEGGVLTGVIENGWTVIEPAIDTIIYYVSDSDGNDTNNGLTPETAFKTFAMAYSQTSDNRADWILLKRGDTFLENVSLRYGRSLTEPYVVSSYGESTIRPLFKTGSTNAIQSVSSFQYFSIIGIDFYAHTRDPNSPEFVNYDGGGSIDLYRNLNAPGNGILIENCAFRYYTGSAIQGATSPDNIKIRRNIFEYSFRTNAHSSGVFMKEVSNVLFEENILDHNGWLVQSFNGGQEEGQATQFNHNTYFNGLTDLIYRGNMLLRGSTMGSKFSAEFESSASNYSIDNNLYVDNEVGIGMGRNYDVASRFRNITINNNVLLDFGQSQPTNRTLGWGMFLHGLDDGEIFDNYFLHNPNQTIANAYAIEFDFSSNLYGTYFYRNVIHGIYTANSNALIRLTNGIDNNSIEFYDNSISSPLYSNVLIEMSTVDEIFSPFNNRYFSNRDPQLWFSIDNVDYDFDAWISLRNETGSTNTEPSFCDAERNIETYQTSISGVASIDAFIVEAKKQGKFHWRDEYDVNTVNNWIRDGFAICQ